MLVGYKRSQTSIILRVKILDSAATTGAGKTGLTSASAGLIISTIADNEAAATAYTVTGSTIESITTLGTYAAPIATKCRFKEVDATNHKGVYEIQLADARFAVANAKSLLISISGAAGAAETDVVIPLRDLDPYTAPATLAQVGGAPWDAMRSAHTTPDTYGEYVNAQLTAAGIIAARSLASGTADSGSMTTVVDAARTEADADYWKGRWIVFTSGTIAGQMGLITAFDPGTDTITFSPATTQAVSTNTYEILPAAAVDVRLFGGTAGTFDAGRPEVKLGNVPHGGTAATFTFERMIGASTTTNEPCVKFTGNGVGAGLRCKGGATGDGLSALSGDTSGTGIVALGAGSGSFGMWISGNATGLRVSASPGHGIHVTANGTDKHGALIVGGTAGTSDGIKVTAGTGGVDIRGNITGNLTGNVSGSVGSVTGNLGGNVSGSIGSLAAQAQTDMRTAVGLASANLDTQLSTIAGYIDTEIQVIVTAVGLIADIKTKTDQLAFTTANRVDSTVVDKTGFKLASDGLDSISTTAPAGVAANFREMLVQVWRRFFKKSTLSSTQLKTFADNGTDVLTTQTVSDDLTTQTQGDAS